MTTDINQRLAEIKERAEKATEGPWRMRPKTYDDWGYIRSPDDSFVAVARAGSFQSDIELDEHRRNKTDPTQHNMEFIANARSDVPFLLAVNEAEKARNQGLVDAFLFFAREIIDCLESNNRSSAIGKLLHFTRTSELT